MSRSHDFLRRLFGDIDGYIEIRPIEDRSKDEDRGRVISGHRAWYGSVERLINDHARIVDTCRENRWAAFFGVLPRVEKGQGKSEDASPAAHVWVDVDFRDYADGQGEARTRIAGLMHQPSAIIHSGHGLHLYWWLSEDAAPGDLSIMSDALALRLDADACHDAARILRLPGSWNVKDPKKPILVRVEELHDQRVYHLADLMEGLPDEIATAQRRAEPIHIDSDAVAGLSERVVNLLEGEQHLSDLWHGRGKTGGDTSGSGYDFAFVYELTWHGVRDPDELVAALLARHGFHGTKKHSSYPSKTVGKALSKRVAADENLRAPIPPPPEYDGPPPHDFPPDLEDGGMVFERGDQAEMADRMLGIYGGQDMLASEGERMYLCDPDTWLWSERTASETRGSMKRWFHQAWRKAPTAKDPDAVRPLTLDYNKLNGAAKLLVDSINTRGFINKPKSAGIAFRNVLVSLDEEPRPIRRTDWLTTADQIDIEFDETATCVEWIRALSRIWPGDTQAELDAFEHNVNLLQEFFGACLFGLGPKYQKVLILVGDGNNGKSVIVKMLEKLFPEQACTSVPIQQLGHEYYNEMLLHSRVNIVGELPARDVLDASAFKGIVDGSLTPARRIREAPISFHPKATHIFSANTLPQSNDHSEGFWRRIMALHFTREFKPTDPDYDPMIIEKLTRELPGIAVWAVRGAWRLEGQRKYTTTEAGDALVEQWRRESNSVALFAHEHVRASETETSGSRVYKIYCDFCKITNHRPVSATTFGKRFKRLGFEHRTSGKVLYKVVVTPVLSDSSARYDHAASWPP